MRSLAAFVAAVAIAGCGAAEPPTQPDARPGRLVVYKSLTDGPIFIEGSVTHLRIAGEDGAQVLDGLRPIPTLDVALFDGPVAAGTYELRTVERPCSGNCEHLDPPADDTRCKLEVSVSADRTTRVRVVLRATPEGVSTDCAAL
jgi:hypothetical protein